MRISCSDLVPAPDAIAKHVSVNATTILSVRLCKVKYIDQLLSVLWLDMVSRGFFSDTN